jgi:RimJ/RimL family protein N-acetyltransferase
MLEWNGIVVLTTPRLLLRTFRRDDLAHYAALNADLEVVRYLGGVPMTQEGSDQMADWAQERHAQEGIGLLAVERRADGAFLGMCGLHHLDWYPDDVEIGWRFAREHWGNGYATEAASAWLGHAFEVLQLPRVISVSDVPNLRSIGVMHRVGMLFDHAAELEAGGVVFAAVVHSITADQWRTRSGRPGCGCVAG